MQRNLITLLLSAACLLGQRVVAASYSTEATMSLQRAEGTLNVDVRVSRLSQQNGKLVEQLVEAPRITTAPGVPATLHSGPQPGDSNYVSKENVTVEVFWPYPKESGVAFCAVTVQRGNEIVSKSRLQLKVEGSGRMPLIVAARDVNSTSVRVVEEQSQVYLLLEFAGKTKEEVKKLAVENYGNQVRILDVNGGLTEGGLSFGTYHEVGMALHYNTRNEAERVASLLRGRVLK
jgi:hypothetical protein